MDTPYILSTYTLPYIEACDAIRPESNCFISMIISSILSVDRAHYNIYLGGITLRRATLKGLGKEKLSVSRSML